MNGLETIKANNETQVRNKDLEKMIMMGAMAKLIKTSRDTIQFLCSEKMPCYELEKVTDEARQALLDWSEKNK